MQNSEIFNKLYEKFGEREMKIFSRIEAEKWNLIEDWYAQHTKYEDMPEDIQYERHFWETKHRDMCDKIAYKSIKTY